MEAGAIATLALTLGDEEVVFVDGQAVGALSSGDRAFTNDIDLLEAALAGLADDSGHAVVRKRAQISTLQRIDKARSAGRALLYARQYAEEQMSGVQYTTDALERLIIWTHAEGTPPPRYGTGDSRGRWVSCQVVRGSLDDAITSR